MRIVGGRLKRRKLRPPPASAETRPIPDRVKESLFNLLRGHFEGATVVDGFAGTGTIGLEAISRGATRVIFLERDKRTARVLEQNLTELGVLDKGEIVTADALGPAALARIPQDTHLVFFDPPYAMVRDPGQWPRVRAQFERLIERLDDTGFAMLRTPWPAVQLIAAQHDSGPADHQGGPEAAEPLVIDLGSGDEPDDAELDAFERELAAAAGVAERVELELQMRGAEGPETHVYGNTAAHLYMKRGAEG
ncbi:MAG: RsmD family RNA methyltransferase [Planctomycetota bacterium]